MFFDALSSLQASSPVSHCRSIDVSGSATVIPNCCRLTTKNREMKMTWAILSVFLCYEVCATPISILFLLELRGTSYWLVSVMIYLFQFTLNFFVYAFQSEQYRKAYVDYLKHLKLSIIRCKCVEVTSDIPEWQRSTLTRSRRPRSSFHQAFLPTSPQSAPPIITDKNIKRTRKSRKSKNIFDFKRSRLHTSLSSASNDNEAIELHGFKPLNKTLDRSTSVTVDIII